MKADGAKIRGLRGFVEYVRGRARAGEGEREEREPLEEEGSVGRVRWLAGLRVCSRAHAKHSADQVGGRGTLSRHWIWMWM